MGSYKPVPEDGRYGAENSPQSRKEDVAFYVPMRNRSLADEKALDGWREYECVDGKYGAPRATAGTRGARDEQGTTDDVRNKD